MVGTAVKEDNMVVGEGGERKYLIVSPDIEVKGDVRFDLQFVVLCRLKYTVVCAVIVLEQLTVQKPERKADGEFDL